MLDNWFDNFGPCTDKFYRFLQWYHLDLVFGFILDWNMLSWRVNEGLIGAVWNIS